MCQASRVLLILTTSLLCITLGGNIASLLGTSWMEVHSLSGGVQKKSVELGLIRSCEEFWKFPRNVSCGVNLDLFKFDKKKEWDIAAVLLITSSSFISLAVLSTFSMMMTCCQRRKKHWLYGATIASFFTFCGAIGNLIALVFFEIEWYGRTHVINYDRGWCNIVGWANAGIGLGTFAFSCTLMCVKPLTYSTPAPGASSSPVESAYPMTNYGVQNQGYQERNEWDKNQSYNGVIKEFYATQANM